MSSPDWAEIVAPTEIGTIERVERLFAGRNSRVHRVDGALKSVVVKQYYRQGVEPSPRQVREFHALTFLWNRGVRSIPEPLHNDTTEGVLVLSCLEGAPALRERISQDDIDEAVRFLRVLLEHRDHPDASKLGDASDAAYRLEELRAGVVTRIDRLVRERTRLPAIEATVRPFVERDLPDIVNEAFARARTVLGDTTLPERARILSPSDFGFHNAVRTPRGLAFLDFEHFGWDDPAKTIADFVLHPGMDVAEPLRRSFARQTVALLGEADAELAERTRLIGPLYAAKWATILLNELLPDQAARRSFAGAETQVDAPRLSAQLDKARRVLRQGRDFTSVAGL